jgi:hypothetical protein
MCQGLILFRKPPINGHMYKIILGQSTLAASRLFPQDLGEEVGTS